MGLFGRKKSVAEARVSEPPQEQGLPKPPAANADGLRSMTDHRDYVLSLVQPLRPYGMNLLDAGGLALCEDIRATENLPAFDCAELDGFALRAEDVAGCHEAARGTLRIKEPGVGEVKVGACVRVGAADPIPLGADAVIPLYRADVHADTITVRHRIRPGDHIRPLGSDVRDGEALLQTGDVVGPRQAALLAAAGFDRVIARPRPRVVVVSLGGSLTQTGRRLDRHGQVHDVNSHLLAAAARAAGATVWRVGAPDDDEACTRTAVSDQLIRADLIIAVGGVSAEAIARGERILAPLGRTDFAELAMEPGHQQGFGLLGEDEIPLLVFPGDPIGAYVSYQAFGLPVIRRLMGMEPAINESVPVVLDSDIDADPSTLEVQLATISRRDGMNVATVVADPQHRLGSLGAAQALLLLPEGRGRMKAGETAMCWLFPQGAFRP